MFLGPFQVDQGQLFTSGSAQAEVSKWALVKFIVHDQFPLAEQDPQPAPQAANKKKKKKAKRGGQTKAAGAGLEGFVDWMDLTSSELTEERKDDMSSLTAGFAARMHK